MSASDIMFQLVRTDQDSHSTTLSPGIHEFGRGVFLDCKDKRVSRCHGQLAVGEDNRILLTALHKNPCFVTAKHSPGFTVITRGMTKELREGDMFGLLPDSHWYRLVPLPTDHQQYNVDMSNEADKKTAESPSLLLGTDVKGEINSDVDVEAEHHCTTDAIKPEPVAERDTEPTKRCHPADVQCSSAKQARLSTDPLQIDEEATLEMKVDDDSTQHQSGELTSKDFTFGSDPVQLGPRQQEVVGEEGIGVIASGGEGSHRDYIDSGSESDDADDDIRVPQSRVRNAVLMSDQEEDIEPEIAKLLSVVSEVQDAADDELLVSAAADSTFTWSSDFSTFTASQEVFIGSPGPTTPCDTPYENFCQIWSPDIMHTIAVETNRYARQTITRDTENRTLGERSRIRNWVDTNVDELYVLFAIFMYMAIDSRTRLEEYWMTNSVLEMPRFGKVMTYHRYTILTRFLHFVDNCSLGQHGSDRKVAKVQPIIDHCNSKFQGCYVPHQYIAIDESLLLWEGHQSWIQNIMTKAARFGIKTYELCESHTGYLWKFRVCTGKPSDVSSNYTGLNLDLTGKTSAIVLDMVEDLHHKGYCVTMDNFYNSPALARHLKTLGIDCIGTLRISRKNVPDDLKRLNVKTMASGAIESRHCGDVSVQSWKDSKLVTTISTYHRDETYVGRQGNKLKTKPVVFKDYNTAMGGVDIKDQKLSMYLLERKRTHKWYVKLFKRLLNVSILNALVMHHHTKLSKGQKPLTHRKFRHELADQLIDKHHTLREIPAAPESSVSDRLDGRDHVMYGNFKMCECCQSLPTQLRDCDKCKTCKPLRRRCARCMANGSGRRDSKYHCKKCGVALCVGRCFMEYHTVKDLTKRG